MFIVTTKDISGIQVTPITRVDDHSASLSIANNITTQFKQSHRLTKPTKTSVLTTSHYTRNFNYFYF